MACQAGVLPQVQKFTLRTLRQRSHQLLQFAALALPPDPALLGVTEPAVAVQHDETRRASAVKGVTRIEVSNLGHGRLKQLGVGGQHFGVGIRPVGEQRKLGLRLWVAQVMLLQAQRQALGGGAMAQHGRNHHHDTVFFGNARGQGQARQVLRPDRFTDEPVDQGHHGFGGGQQHQPRGQQGQGTRQVEAHGAGGITQQPRHQRQGAADHGGQVTRQCHVAPNGRPSQAKAGGQPQRNIQIGTAWATEPMRGHRLAGERHRVVGHEHQQCFSDGHFAAMAALRKTLNGMQRHILGADLLGLKHRGRQHQAHQGAGAGHDVGPVGVANGSERGHGVADTQVVGGLVGRLVLNHRPVGQHMGQPRLVHRIAGRTAVLQTLHHLPQKYQLHPPKGQPFQQSVKVARSEVFNLVAAEVGHFPRCLVGGHALGQAAQVLNQHHPQRGRKRPHLTEVELPGFLVRQQKLDQQVLVKSTVGVGHKSPGDAVNPRQTRQRLVLQHRQSTEIAPRQAFVDFLGLCANQMKIVQQPFRSRADVKPGAGLRADKAVRLAQHFDVVLQPRKEVGCP